MALTQQQTQKLHTTIEQRRKALLSELQDDVDRVRRDRHEDLAGASPDAGDESVATLIADLDHADVDRDLNELRDLEAARARLADGSYGTCADCGSEIGYERLKKLTLDPWAEYQSARQSITPAMWKALGAKG